MNGIVPDVNFQGQMRVLMRILEGEEWIDVWQSLNLAITTFEDLGLAETASDREIWTVCQKTQVILVTGNRNKDGPDSLESTIQDSNTPQSLPVFTVGHPERVLPSKSYAERIVRRLLEFLIDIDAYRGTGRLYLP